MRTQGPPHTHTHTRTHQVETQAADVGGEHEHINGRVRVELVHHLKALREARVRHVCLSVLGMARRKAYRGYKRKRLEVQVKKHIYTHTHTWTESREPSIRM